MKKLVLLMVVPFAFNFATSAQVTQSEADSIVLERLSIDSQPHTVYAKANTQADSLSISTALGELLDLDYPCWIYYVRYDEQADSTPTARRYFVVKESNGNLLQVNTKNDVSPPDLETWRKVPADPEPPLDSLVLIAKGNLTGSEGIPKQNLVITTQTDWENLITAMNSVNNVSDSFAEINIDFSKYQVIAVFDEVKSNGGWSVDITDITENTDSVVVLIENLKRGDSTSVVTQPFYIVKIPVSEKPIVFLYYPTAYYVIGYDMNCAVTVYGDNTAKANGVYVIVSEDLRDTLAAHLPDTLFAFPAEIMPCCVLFGFNLFPQDYRFAYKIQMNYRPMTTQEMQDWGVVCFASADKATKYFFSPTYILITSVFRMP